MGYRIFGDYVFSEYVAPESVLLPVVVCFTWYKYQYQDGTAVLSKLVKAALKEHCRFVKKILF